MAQTGVRITGLRETIRSLEKLGVETADLKAAFTKIGEDVASDARAITPVLTGRLSGSIRPSRAKNKATIRAGSASVPYAGVIHYGWPGHNIAPQPFLADAADDAQDRSAATVEDELRNLIRKYQLT